MSIEFVNPIVFGPVSESFVVDAIEGWIDSHKERGSPFFSVSRMPGLPAGYAIIPRECNVLLLAADVHEAFVEAYGAGINPENN